MNRLSRFAASALASDLGLWLIRSIAGVVFVFHGSQKLFGWFGGHGLSATADWMGSIGIPLPMLSALLAGSAEFFGGLALLAGVGTRIASVPLAFTMLVAVSVHGGAFDARSGGMEYPLTLAAVAAGLGLTGPGRLTLGRLGQAWHRSAPGESLPAGGRA